MFVYKQYTLNVNREVCLALQIIYGIGWHKSIIISTKMGLSFPFIFKNLNSYNLQMLSFLLDYYTWLEVRIKHYIFQNIKKLFEINSYKGLRHKDSLPTRGQRTRTNASTKKKNKNNFKWNNVRVLKIKIKRRKLLLLIYQKKLFKKKENIFFKYGIGHLLFFQKHSNVFLVLKTEKKEHVVTLTGGSCRIGTTKKQKVSPHNVNLIIKELKEYCKVYDIERVRFFLKSTINKHYYNIMKYLSLYNIKVIEIGYVLHMPHNGMRGRKFRRI